MAAAENRIPNNERSRSPHPLPGATETDLQLDIQGDFVGGGAYLHRKSIESPCEVFAQPFQVDLSSIALVAFVVQNFLY